MSEWEVRVGYDFDLWPAMDEVVYQAAGRNSTFSGAGFGKRDHGWLCGSEIEARRIHSRLKAIGLAPAVRTVPDESETP